MHTWKSSRPCIRVHLSGWFASIIQICRCTRTHGKFLVHVFVCIYLDDLPALSGYVDAPEHMEIFVSMYSCAIVHLSGWFASIIQICWCTRTHEHFLVHVFRCIYLDNLHAQGRTLPMARRRKETEKIIWRTKLHQINTPTETDI